MHLNTQLQILLRKTKMIYRLLRDTEKLLSITDYQRNANENHIEVSFHTDQIGHD